MGTPYDLTHEYIEIKKFENYQSNIDEYVNYINDISKYLTDLEIRLFSDGLNREDIGEIKDAINKLYAVDFAIKKNISFYYSKRIDFYDLVRYQKYLLREIGDIGVRLIRILKSLRIAACDYDLKSFIKDNASLLHLVSTNNHSNQHIRKTSDDSYFYLCAFHNERRSSMRVKNNKNKLCCYGCGIELNIFEYLRAIESISYEDAILLLAEINKIRIDDNKFKAGDEIVRKYTNASALRRYEMRVISGRKRADCKMKTLNNLLAREKFNQEIDTIRRIRENEYISYPNEDKQNKVLKMTVGD